VAVAGGDETGSGIVSTRAAPEGTQAVIRALGLLKAFTRALPEQSLAELSEATGLAKTTAHRLLTALESEGLVARNPVTKSFRLGPAALALGTQALISNDLRTVVEPELRLLVEHTGETATLEVPLEGNMLILAEVSGRHLVTVAAELGTRWPIHATSTGKAYLAALSAEDRRAILVPPLVRLSAATVVDLEQLEKDLGRVRQLGYATASDEIEVGASAVGAVLINALGEPVGGISVNGPTSRFRPQYVRTLGRELAAAAARLAPLIHTL
jgi:IclR family acetate operon transcriptional repressor